METSFASDYEDRWAEYLFNAYNGKGPNPGKTWDGRDVPPWKDCGFQVQEKWRAVARAAKTLKEVF